MDRWRKKNKKKQILDTGEKQVLERGAKLLEDLIECCDGKSNPIKFFSADEIRKATDSDSVFQKSSFGYNYWCSGKNENQDEILIKKTEGIFHAYREFVRDITISSMVSGHKNFLRLVGCCLEFEKPVMVYDGVKKHYELDISEQPWKRRMKIAEDIATALAYLHTAFPRPFIYRILDHKNILLDEDGVAKLFDFSCCVLIPKGETFVKVSYLEGPFALMNFKYETSGVVSEKTDVFAIGILMQTFLVGKERFWKLLYGEDEKAKGDGDGNYDTDDSITMAKKNAAWFLSFMKERRVDEIADPKMLENMGENSEQELCQMKAFRMLSLRCVGLKGEVPTIVEVAKELKKIQRSLINDSSSSSFVFEVLSERELK